MADDQDLMTTGTDNGVDESQESRPRPPSRSRRKQAEQETGAQAEQAGDGATTAVLDAPSMVDTSVDRSEPRQDREFSRRNRNDRNRDRGRRDRNDRGGDRGYSDVDPNAAIAANTRVSAKSGPKITKSSPIPTAM